MNGDPPPLRIEHVRRPSLPWRPEDLTECGLPTADHPVITRDALAAKVKREGRTRAAYTTCQTCLQTGGRHPTWDDDPVGRMQREVGSYRGDRRDRVRAELIAIAALIDAHRDEFDATLAGLGDVTDIGTQRTQRQRRAADTWRTRGI